jgi:hypothetical protein
MQIKQALKQMTSLAARWVLNLAGWAMRGFFCSALRRTTAEKAKVPIARPAFFGVIPAESKA